MRFDNYKDPAAAASRDESPYARNGVALVQRGAAEFLASTDGRMLLLVRAYRDEADTPVGIYPVEAFNAARKGAGRHATEAGLTLNGSAKVLGQKGVVMEFPMVDGKFPDVAAVVPKGAVEQRLGIDAELLAKIQKGLGASAVRIEIHGLDNGDINSSLPLTIRPIYGDGASGVEDGSFGLLMPMDLGRQ